MKTKNNLLIRFNKIREQKLYVSYRVYNGENIEDRDIRCFTSTRKTHDDINFIFRHKGKYKAYLYARDTYTDEHYGCIANYEFECEEEWGNEVFTFPIEVHNSSNKSFEEQYEEFKCECNIKNNVFKAENRQKMNFKFKPDSGIIVTDVYLIEVIKEESKNRIENCVKYYSKDKDLDIDSTFNKKGKYQLLIYYFDKDLFDGMREHENKYFKMIYYYPIVETDLKEETKFSDEEVLITRSFEDSLKLANFKYISHKEQKISSEGMENFEFEFESKGIYGTNLEIYPKNTDSFQKELELTDNKIIYHCTFDENIKYIVACGIKIWGTQLCNIVYIISLSDYYKKVPKVRKNILETLDREKLKKIVLSCKKRTEISLNEFR